MMRFHLRFVSLLAAGLLLLGGCSPTFDWREVHGTAPAPYTVLLPGKPATFSRDVQLGETTTSMTMTAADIRGISFAVGTARLPDAAQAARALPAMKAALVRNINGTVRQETASQAADGARIDVEARGAQGANGAGTARLLVARFISRGPIVYQVVLVGPETTISRETIETFFTSFKPGAQSLL